MICNNKLDDLREYINYFITLSDEEWSKLSELFEIVDYKAGEHIYSKSEIPDSIFFILDGIVRSYKLEDDGKDYTWSFHCLNMDTLEHRMLMDAVVVDYVSFTKNIPEVLAFEVLADSTLVKIDKDKLYSLYDSSIKWQKFATKMAEDSFAVVRERTLNLLTKNAKERLELLISYFPQVFEKDVPLKHIASYLGITRQSLNRLLKDINI